MKKKDITTKQRKELNKDIKYINQKIKVLKAEKKKYIEQIKEFKNDINELIDMLAKEYYWLIYYRLLVDVWMIYDEEKEKEKEKKKKTKTTRRRKDLDIKIFNDRKYKRIFKNLKLSVYTSKKKFILYNNEYIYDYNSHFDQLLEILDTDKNFKDKNNFVNESTSLHFGMIHVKSVILKNQRTRYSPTTTDLHDNINNNSIYFKYIDYDFNKDAKTFYELINNDNKDQIKGSCYIDLLLKTYKGSIEKRINFDSRKAKANSNKLLTVEKICELCDIKYKSDNIGLSLKKSLNFF